MDLREMPVACADRSGKDAEARHPWEQSRARFFRGQLARCLRPGARVLDIGAGDGYLVSSLLPAVKPSGSIVCVDTGYSDDHLTRFSAAAPPEICFTREVPDTSFDVVLLLDVLEHVPDDRAFLAGIVRDVLAPGGVLLASVPAHPFLFTRHDVSLGHYRRYRLGELTARVRETGLAVEASGGLFHSLLPVRIAQKMGEIIRGVKSRPALEAVSAHADTGLTAGAGSHWLSKVTLTFLALDNQLSNALARSGLSLPGLSVWARARKT